MSPPEQREKPKKERPPGWVSRTTRKRRNKRARRRAEKEAKMEPGILLPAAPGPANGRAQAPSPAGFEPYAYGCVHTQLLPQFRAAFVEKAAPEIREGLSRDIFLH